MRRIRVNGLPPKAWLAKSARLLALLDAAAEDERAEIIETNSKHYRALRSWLMSLSHNKCWFSEAKESVSYYDVEHYRPKNATREKDGAVYDGYWWLAFDYHNFRLSGSAVNRKKSTYFPLAPGCVRRGRGDDLRLEQPMLLDPIDKHDFSLLSFDREGNAIPAPHVPVGSWSHDRVTYSIERCNLIFSGLVDGRKAMWQQCAQLAVTYCAELDRYDKDRSNTIALKGLQDAAEGIANLADPSKPFSAVVHACIKSFADPRLDPFLRT